MINALPHNHGCRKSSPFTHPEDRPQPDGSFRFAGDILLASFEKKQGRIEMSTFQRQGDVTVTSVKVVQYLTSWFLRVYHLWIRARSSSVETRS